MSKSNMFIRGICVGILMQASVIQANASCIPCYRGENLWCFTKRIAQELCSVSANSQSCCENLDNRLEVVESCCQSLIEAMTAEAALIGSVFDKEDVSCCPDICVNFTKFKAGPANAELASKLIGISFMSTPTNLVFVTGGPCGTALFPATTSNSSTQGVITVVFDCSVLLDEVQIWNQFSLDQAISTTVRLFDEADTLVQTVYISGIDGCQSVSIGGIKVKKIEIDDTGDSFTLRGLTKLCYHCEVVDLLARSCCDDVRNVLESCCESLQSKIDHLTTIDSLSCCDDLKNSIESCCQILQSQIDVVDEKIDSCCDRLQSQIDVLDVNIQSCCQTLQEQINAGGAAAQSCCEAQGVLIGEALSCCDAVSGRLESCCQTLQEQIDVLDMSVQSCCQTLQEQINGLDGTIQSCCQTLQEQINAGGAAAQSCCEAQGVLIGEALSCCDAVSGRLESCCQTLQEQIDILEGNIQSCCQTLQEQINAGGAAAQSCCDAQGVLIGDALSCCDDLRGSLESCCQTLQSQINNLSIVDKGLQSQIDVIRLIDQSCCQTLQSQINALSIVDKGLQSQIDLINKFEKSCCDTLQSQINVIENTLESCCDRSQSCFNKGCLIFTPFDLSDKDGGDPDVILKPYGNDRTVPAWKMSANGNEDELQLQFQVPCDFDQTSSFVEAQVHLMIGKEGGAVGRYAKLQVKASFKGNNQNIGTTFEQMASSVDILIVEPANSYDHILVPISLSTNSMAVDDWAILSFNRVAPTGVGRVNYNKNIYLTVLGFKYQKKCNN